MREVLLAVSLFCSVAIALAASSARLFSAAWAPIASDTTPARAAAMVRERREMRSCLTFIRFVSCSLILVIGLGAPIVSRAWAILVLGMRARYAAQLRS